MGFSTKKKKNTRLFLLVSKPILIVVLVVIDVVFVKTMLGPKKFWLKKIHIQKNCSGQKELSPKKLWSKKMLTKKLRFKKILGPNNVAYKKFW